MNKFKLHIRDSSFAHTPMGASLERIPKYFEWCRDQPGKDDWCVYTNFDIVNNPHNPEKSIAWLYESPQLLGHLRADLDGLLRNYKYVVTNDGRIKETHNLRYLNAHSTFIDTQTEGFYTPGTLKTEFCSLICSDKTMTSGHCFRRGLVDFLVKHFPEIHCYGSAFNKPLPKKVDGLASYQYSIVIENGIHEGYYSEKLLDAIYCETVPIYFGDPIKSKMSCVIDGFEWLRNFDLNKDLYEKKYRSVRLARNSSFLDAPEDQLYTKILSEIL